MTGWFSSGAGAMGGPGIGSVVRIWMAPLLSGSAQPLPICPRGCVGAGLSTVVVVDETGSGSATRGDDAGRRPAGEAHDRHLAAGAAVGAATTAPLTLGAADVVVDAGVGVVAPVVDGTEVGWDPWRPPG